MEHPDFSKVAKEQWESYQIEGWAGYRCKEKLKQLKLFFRGWNRVTFGNFDEQIEKEVSI